MTVVAEPVLDRENGTTSLEVNRIAGRIGAEIRNFSLARDLAGDGLSAVRAALVKYKVIFFRDQTDLDDAGQEAVAEALGDPVKHPTSPVASGSRFLLELDARAGYGASSWHTDVTFVPRYPQASILRAVAVPDAGGDTMWANCVTAYADLPAPLRLLADGLRAVHSNDYDYEPSVAHPDGDDESGYRQVFTSTVYESEHPVVRIHPASGEKALVLGHFLKRFVGFGIADSRRLYELLQAHVIRPENTVRWRWRVGDVAIWDNRATQHRSVADFGRETRLLRRATVSGDLPVGPDGQPSRALSTVAKG